VTALEENLIYQQHRRGEMLAALDPKQRARLQSYMRDGGLSFDEAYEAALLTDPPIRYAVRLVVEPIHVNAPRGRKLTRRQRRKR
jgi:hypothetical protein